MKRVLEALFPSAGDPVAHELNSQGLVSGVAGSSDEPDSLYIKIVDSSEILLAERKYLPVPDSFSAGAERTTESPALVRAL